MLESSCMGNFILNWGLLLLQMLTTPYSAIEREILTAVRFLLLNVNENTHQICGPEGSDCKGGCTKRFVVKRLKAAGYSASVCKTKWPTSGRVPGGTICKLHLCIPCMKRHVKHYLFKAFIASKVDARLSFGTVMLRACLGLRIGLFLRTCIFGTYLFTLY